jgi:acyl-CoA thioesterase-1
MESGLNLMKWLLLTLALLPLTSLRAAEPVILLLGDSISAGYGVPLGQGWASLLQARLKAEDLPQRLVNASISGDTTRGGLARLPEALERHSPGIVIIELGGNDGLRGISPQEMKANLGRMIQLSRAAGARVLLVGMRLPPNFGPVFTQRFAHIYRELAEEQHVPLVPFLLEGVATDRSLMQADGIHPNAVGQPRLLDNLWPYLAPLLAKAKLSP